MASVMSAAASFLLVDGGRRFRAVTRSSIGLLVLFATVGGSFGAAGIDPAAMLTNFCPCVGRWDCSTPFGDDGQHGLQGILEVCRLLYMIFVNFPAITLCIVIFFPTVVLQIKVHAREYLPGTVSELFPVFISSVVK
jgi:hypothetical protein